MGNISTTAGTLGGATAATIVAVWYMNGHQTPVPEDVIMSMSVLVGVVCHSIAVVAVWASGFLPQRGVKVPPFVMPPTGLPIPVPPLAAPKSDSP